ncbi:hypothetical protein LOK49_LG03G02105 [Camellia lanceoleosa]|uniref:Uncharacterized protein n=1 Tax=Camellia lanceoleosa TaxID=1840588 RepID=A0ACC0IC67_9ERIC|nr:hypothetical protein LOK49_LG03G02105 [Camellia lanceoleosa]
MEHSGSPSKLMEEIRERLNVMKANIAWVNRDDLIPQVFLQDELSTPAEKAFSLLQPRWSDLVEHEGSEEAVLNRFRDISDNLVIARARNLVLALNPVKNVSEGVDWLNIPSSVAELYPFDVNMSIAEGEVSYKRVEVVPIWEEGLANRGLEKVEEAVVSHIVLVHQWVFMGFPLQIWARVQMVEAKLSLSLFRRRPGLLWLPLTKRLL